MTEADSQRNILCEVRQKDAWSPWTDGDSFVSALCFRTPVLGCVWPFSHLRHSLKTTESPRERVFNSLARATILVTTQARRSQGTVNLDLGYQALGVGMKKSLHSCFYRYRLKHFSTQPRHYWKCRWGWTALMSWWGKGLHPARCSHYHWTGCAL